MAAAAILKSVKRHNSAIFEQIFTKFDTDIENKVSGQLLESEFVSNKIQDGGGRHIGNYIFGHNLAIIACICTEFETEVENGVPQTDLPSKFT